MQQTTAQIFAAGRTTGMAVYLGTGCTVAALYEGYPLPHCTHSSDIGGDYILGQFHRALYSSQDMTDILPRHIKQTKEALCFCPGPYASDQSADVTPAMLYDLARGETLTKTETADNYALPDGTILNAVAAKATAVESIFSPGGERVALPDLVYKLIKEADIEIRSDMLQNMVLAGGSSLFMGLDQRLHHEIRGQVHSEAKVKVVHSHDAQVMAWQGGSVCGALSTFKSAFISAAQYAEQGTRAARIYLQY